MISRVTSKTRQSSGSLSLHRRARQVTLLLAGCLLAALGLALATGSVPIPVHEIARRLAGWMGGHPVGDAIDRILFAARLPRVLLGMLAGSSLALAGLAAQTLFRNPLASPSIIGVSNGAALGAVGGLLLAASVGIHGTAAAITASVATGLAVTAVVFALGRRGSYFGHGLLLAGIAVGALCSSLTTAMLYLAGERLQAIVFWLMGGLWQANWQHVLILALASLAGLACMVVWSRDLNVFLLGERTARDLGLDVPKLQRRLLALIAVLASVTVSLTGVIGFIGLIVPHLVRLLVGADHRRLVVPVALGGALLLVLADTCARTLAAPAEIPVGIFTAVVGAPVFLWLLQTRRTQAAP